MVSFIFLNGRSLLPQENELQYLKREAAEEKENLNQVTAERDNLGEQCRGYEQNLRELQQSSEENNRRLEEVKQLSEEYKAEIQKLQHAFQQLEHSEVDDKRLEGKSENSNDKSPALHEKVSYELDSTEENAESLGGKGTEGEKVWTLRQKLKHKKSVLREVSTDKERLEAKCADYERELQGLHEQLQDYEYNLGRTMSKLRKYKESSKVVEDKGYRLAPSPEENSPPSRGSPSVARVPVQNRQKSEEDFRGSNLEHAHQYKIRSRGSNCNNSSATSQTRYRSQPSFKRRQTSASTADSDESENSERSGSDAGESDRPERVTGEKERVASASDDNSESDV